MKRIDFKKTMNLLILILLVGSINTDLHAQFTKNKKSGISSDAGGGGHLLECLMPKESFKVTLLFTDLATFENIQNDLAIGWGCDLYIGITSSLGKTSYTYAGNPNDYYYDDSFLIENVLDSNNSYDEYRGLVGSIDCSVPLTDEKSECVDLEQGFFSNNNEISYYDLSHTINLYCKDGDNFIPVDACENEDYFHLDLIDGCSLEAEIDIKICCDDKEADPETELPDGPGMGMIRNEGENTIEATFALSQITNNGFEYDVRNSKNSTISFIVYDLKALEVSKGNLPRNEGTHFQSLDNLRTGIYILSIIDSNGNVESKKFFKM